jgi:hypothetical protein
MVFLATVRGMSTVWIFDFVIRIPARAILGERFQAPVVLTNADVSTLTWTYFFFFRAGRTESAGGAMSSSQLPTWPA